MSAKLPEYYKVLNFTFRGCFYLKYHYNAEQLLQHIVSMIIWFQHILCFERLNALFAILLNKYYFSNSYIKLKAFRNGVFSLMVAVSALALGPHTPLFSQYQAAHHTDHQLWTTSTNLSYLFDTNSLYTIDSQYDDLIQSIAHYYEIDPALVKAIVHAESGFNSKVVSSAGAVGLMQVMPATASIYNVSDLDNPQHNVRTGVRYLRFLLEKFDWNVDLAVAAYNAGPSAVARFDNIPPYQETQHYVKKVLGLRDLYVAKLANKTG